MQMIPMLMADTARNLQMLVNADSTVKICRRGEKYRDRKWHGYHNTSISAWIFGTACPT